jgi:hypothetical protein
MAGNCAGITDRRIFRESRSVNEMNRIEYHRIARDKKSIEKRKGPYPLSYKKEDDDGTIPLHLNNLIH